jgi:mono/diheme cytochrome c family protein
MTEIPEHLLKRSRERRAAIGGGGDDDAGGGGGGDAAPSTSTPATTSSTPAAAAPSGPVERAAAPTPAAPEPPKPDIPVVAAYKSRKRVPFWAMTALALLPLWAFMYARAVTTQAEEAAGPLAEGEVVYGNCASCHGSEGQGGVGYAFADGEVLETFPSIEDQLRFVYFGTAEYAQAEIDVYGDPDREGGAHLTGGLPGGMPAQGADAGGALTDYELLGVVCHERYVLGGASEMEEYDGEFETWCSEESSLYEALEGGESLLTLEEVDDTIIPIGPGPAPAGSSADSEGQPEQG